MHQISIRALALTLAILWGASCLLVGWTASFGWGSYFVDVLSSIYIGYKPGFIGGIAGAIWGFIDGGIWGAALAYLYNHFDKKHSKKHH
jgi:uncharacterized membrane protein